MTTVNVETRTINYWNLETRYSADDFVNPTEVSNNGDPRMNKAWVILDGGFVVAIVFAEYYGYSEQDALDEACDSGKLDGFKVEDSELSDYKTGEDEEGNPEYSGITYLGNASEPFDLEAFDIWQVPAHLFIEDTCLMTTDRVAQRLEEMQGQAYETFQNTEFEGPWLQRKKELDAIEDAQTLFRLMCQSR